MKKIVLLFLLATFLLAQDNSTDFVAEQNSSLGNPKVYSALGDVIYNNVQSIEKLKDIPQFTHFSDKITSYVKEVYEAKDIAYAIEAGDKSLDKKEYLQKIRTLSKTNDFFHRTIMNSYKSSISAQDNDLFNVTINSGLIDTKKYKPEIMEYYFAHCAEMQATDVVQKFLDEDEKLRVEQEKVIVKKPRLTKKQIQEAKIKRIREKDKAKQEALQKTLEEELLKKKSDIRKEQIEELTK